MARVIPETEKWWERKREKAVEKRDCRITARGLCRDEGARRRVSKFDGIGGSKDKDHDESTSEDERAPKLTGGPKRPAKARRSRIGGAGERADSPAPTMEGAKVANPESEGRVRASLP